MADEDWGRWSPNGGGGHTRPVSRSKQGTIVVQPGQPLQFTDVVDVDTPTLELPPFAERSVKPNGLQRSRT